MSEPFSHIIQTLAGMARAHGYVIYAVGGFVRDLYLGRESKDLDIMVEGNDGGILFARLVARELGIREPVIFPRFGTAKLTIEGQEIEFVMPRTEYYAEDSRNPDTAPGTLEQDAKRRDFTMNALFWRLNDDEILDLTGRGFADIAARTIRVADPDNPGLIFSQDPLRMMRAIRQSVQLGFTIEPKTYAAIQESAARLAIVSAERVQDELNAMLVSADPLIPLRMIVEAALFAYIFPEPAMQAVMRRIAAREEMLVSHVPQTIVLRLAALLYEPPPYAAPETGLSRAAMQRLKYSNDMIQSVAAVIRYSTDPLAYTPSWNDGEVRRLILRCGQYLTDIMCLARAHARMARDAEAVSLLDALDRRMAEVQTVLPVSDMGNLLTGDELMALFGRPPGPWIQTIKDLLLQEQLDNPALTKTQARAIARAALSKNTL